MISAVEAEKDPYTFEGHDNCELTSYLGLVAQIARRIHPHLPRCVELDDLMQAGAVGLLDAIRKFDARRHVRFAHYAKFRINGAILDSLRQLDWSPMAVRRKAQQLGRVRTQLGASLGRNPNQNELAHEMGMELDQFHILITDLRGLELCSLEFEHPTGETQQEGCDYPDPHAATVTHSVSSTR